MTQVSRHDYRPLSAAPVTAVLTVVPPFARTRRLPGWPGIGRSEVMRPASARSPRWTVIRRVGLPLLTGVPALLRISARLSYHCVETRRNEASRQDYVDPY